MKLDSKSFMLQVWKNKHLVWECPHSDNSAITQMNQTLIVNTQQANYTGPDLFLAMNLILSQTITAETPNTS